MKFLELPLLAAGILLSSCATSSPPPVIQAAAAENVFVTTLEAGKELQLPAILHKPVGDGPFAAVVMLCGQGGRAGGGPNAEHQTFWARKLFGWGFIALQVESFSSRGPRSLETVSADMVCRDASAAKTYLSALAFVDPENVAVMGWSHGGIAVLSIIDRSLILNREQVISDGQGLSVRKVSPFKVAVAFYPYGHPLSDPNAYHAFDLEALKRGIVINGHHFECDERATSIAITRTRAFHAKYIGAREPPVR